MNKDDFNEELELDTSDWTVPPPTEKMLRERIVNLEVALAEMIGTHGEPCREKETTGDACKAVAQARRVLGMKAPWITSERMTAIAKAAAKDED